MTTLSLLPIKYDVTTISDADYTNTKEEASMSFAERLALQVEQADSRVTMNAMHKPYEWEREANQKRFIR